MEINESKENGSSDIERQEEELQEINIKENEKLNRELEKKEQELTERELRICAREKLLKKGLPIQLSDALNCTSNETLEKSISIIEKDINEYKENSLSGITFKSFQPGIGRTPNVGDSEDAEIRKIMKLN